MHDEQTIESEVCDGNAHRLRQSRRVLVFELEAEALGATHDQQIELGAWDQPAHVLENVILIG
ncbi:MAG: hypothetical protein E6H66_11405 [Betaproteobacteria bacterium]|nr:MAG: hypothetical protein E6H66_11405 [Betaproteobacteria bacterium]